MNVLIGVIGGLVAVALLLGGYWLVTAVPPADRDPRDGVWVAFHWDGSAFVPFATELEALRYALPYAMTVKFARFGDQDWQHGAPTGRKER